MINIYASQSHIKRDVGKTAEGVSGDTESDRTPSYGGSVHQNKEKKGVVLVRLSTGKHASDCVLYRNMFHLVRLVLF